MFIKGTPCLRNEYYFPSLEKTKIGFIMFILILLSKYTFNDYYLKKLAMNVKKIYVNEVAK
jgi:hypothetical protein